MKRINRLGIIVALITAITLLTFTGVFWIGKKFLMNSEESSVAQEVADSSSGQTLEEELATQDTDGDGLPDLVENIYRTDSNNSDTDGDGTKDGDEITLQRDPAKSGPNDQLNQNGEGTYTQKYFSLLPANASREDVLQKERIEAFIEQEKGALLPELPAGTIKINTASGKEAVQTYLESISSTHNSTVHAISSTEIDAAYRLAHTNNQSAKLDDIVSKLEQNVTTFKNISTPQETAELHNELIAASQALLDNTKLLQNTPNDLVGGLLGAKKIEELGLVFQDISQRVVQLEQKYGLE